MIGERATPHDRVRMECPYCSSPAFYQFEPPKTTCTNKFCVLNKNKLSLSDKFVALFKR